MTTEAIQTDFASFDTWPLEERLKVIIDANRRAVTAVQRALPALTEASAGIRERLVAGGRLVYIGAGTSGRLALQDAAELEPTFGFDQVVVLLAGGDDAGKHAQEGAEDDEEAAIKAVRQAKVSALDAVLGIAASGRTPYTVAGLREAQKRGAFTVGVANNANTPLLEVAEIAVLIETGPEVIAGSTRMAAGTAQKIVLNALSTAPMPELGRVYKNLMVGMRPVNEKLYRRAVQIVSAATAKAESAAERALKEANWDIRQAVVSLETGLGPEASLRILEQYDGHIHKAIRAAFKGEN